MLKKIPVSDVRLGMHLHSLEGAWIDHPFWKTRFVLQDAADLAKLRASGLTGVWIDVAKGLDVASEAAALPAQIRSDPRATPATPPAESIPLDAALPPAWATRTLQEELSQAATLLKEGRAQVVSMFGEARLGKAVDAEQCLPLVNDIAESVFRNPGALVSLSRLKSQDDYTYMHSVAVCALMVSLGREMGLSQNDCREAGLAGLLHDLGKAAVPLDILNKPGKLTDAEFGVMRDHPVRGHEMLAEARAVSDGVLEVCLRHHEKMDGSGYPGKFSGDQISRLARMGAVCDVYDAITSNRPYKAGWDPAESVARMASWKGHLDPVTFQAFVKSLGIYPTGSLVKLQSGRLAVVVEQNPKELIAPTVKIFFSTRSQMPMAPQLLDLSRSNDRIVGRENPAIWGFKHLNELWAGDAVLPTS
jgi:HD-GYP domain-containing protein (c-di-GMP phosphodiesterase class II)